MFSDTYQSSEGFTIQFIIYCRLYSPIKSGSLDIAAKLLKVMVKNSEKNQIFRIKCTCMQILN